MAQYFLTVPHDAAEEPTMASMQELDPAELEAMMSAVDDFNARLKEERAFVLAGGLHPPSTATTVDSSGEAPVRTAGPFVDAPAYVGGFWIIDTPDEETALRWAETASQALQSRIEVRALQEAPDA